MKFCPQCGTQLDDAAVVCPNCGANFAAPQAGAVYQAIPDYDHTAEFDAKDISDNKVVAMAVYLLGTIGIIIAAILAGDSKYAGFHVRQQLKLTVLSVLLTICSLVLCWTFIVPIAGGICSLILFVVRIICFFNVCAGKALEPAIVRSFTFLK